MDVPDLVCFDLPCLVDVAPGVVEEGLDRSLRRLGLDATSPLHDAALDAGLGWPGREARTVFGQVFRSQVWADAAAAAYDDAFGACAIRRGVGVARGGREVIAALREAGAAISITTEFSACTREAILDVLDWPDLVAMLLSEESCGDAETGSLVQAAAWRLGLSVRDTAVVAGTSSGVAAGCAAGAGWVVGVLGGTTSAGELLAAGASSVAQLSELVPTALAGGLLSA